ncbi:MAG: hypothetical protein P8N58_05745, partial [Emcibacteraceae bacterium]|nr:hypothetical protein [Emcibacteraceae bacterium]
DLRSRPGHPCFGVASECLEAVWLAKASSARSLVTPGSKCLMLVSAALVGAHLHRTHQEIFQQMI